MPFNFGQHLGKLLNYVDRAYPVGTPLEELDVDLFGLLPQPTDEFVRPVAWIASGSALVMADIVSPSKSLLNDDII